MGACSSSNEDLEKVKRNKEIENEMMKSQLIEDKKIKILLLGAGESGKSTVFKQFRLMYGAPRSSDDLKMYAQVVRHNVKILVKKMIALVERSELKSTFDAVEIVASKKILESLKSRSIQQQKDRADASIHPSQIAAKHMFMDAEECVSLKEEIKIFYNSKTWTVAWLKRSEVNIVDGHEMFLQNLDIISAPDYIPTNEHILNARLRTTSVLKEEYIIDGVTFEVYDAGGQRSERKKWMQNFADVDAVIYVAALSEYDQMLAEATKVNRMKEALNLFGSIANHHAFNNSPILLFLNKKDLFLQKLLIVSIQDQKDFADYSGSSSDDALVYFIQKFRECFINADDPDKRLFVHTTVATDTKNIEFVWDSCKSIIGEQNLISSNMF